MKVLNELTQLEIHRLNAAQSVLRECALRYAMHDTGANLHALYFAAREFDLALRENGMDEYWIQPGSVEIDFPPDPKS